MVGWSETEELFKMLLILSDSSYIFIDPDELLGYAYVTNR